MGLRKNLGFIDLFCLTSGAMISSGIFILPGMAFNYSGPAIIISYLVAGIFALIGILSVTEIITAMPKAGGDYYFISRTLGPLAGTVSGLLSCFAIILKTSFAIFGMAEVTCQILGIGSIFGMSAIFPISLLITLFFTVLNIFGTKEASYAQIIMVVFLLGIMTLFVFFGARGMAVAKFTPFICGEKSGWEGIIWTAGFVFISFGGLLNISSVSEEVKNPRRNLPLGLLASIVIVTVVYVLMLAVTIGVMNADSLRGSMTPIADAAAVFMGKPGYIAITIAAMLAFVTTANAGIMSASRYPMALSRDKLAPAILGIVNERFGTPLVSIFFTALIIILTLLLQIEMLVKAASTVILLSYVLSNISVIILRESRLAAYHPTFKAPFYPLTQIISILVFIYLIFSMGMAAALISLALIGLSLIFYYFYGRKVCSEYALLHLLERITNRKLTSNNLEKELTDVIHERDNIVKDSFDNLIESAPVYDLKGTLTADEFFHRVATDIAKDIERPADELYKLIAARESESSTVISPYVAIPHIILEGNGIFRIFVIRSRDGIYFSEENNSVKSVFLILGTKDMRNFHLKALAAIAQAANDVHFEKKWEEAKNESSLKTILLLAVRKRHK